MIPLIQKELYDSGILNNLPTLNGIFSAMQIARKMHYFIYHPDEPFKTKWVLTQQQREMIAAYIKNHNPFRENHTADFPEVKELNHRIEGFLRLDYASKKICQVNVDFVMSQHKELFQNFESACVEAIRECYYETVGY